ncbi:MULTISPECIES: hypothetical protein [unclassified Caballeronia]|uniref:hypothetical protein n=1 Tax=unclassified Caballeronia TaxID=2646786 RepID=UPI0032EDFDE9
MVPVLPVLELSVLVLSVLDAGAGALAVGEDVPLDAASSEVSLAVAGGLVVSLVVPVPDGDVSDPVTLAEEADALPLCAALLDDALSLLPPPPPPHAATNTLTAATSAIDLNRMKRKAGAKFVISIRITKWLTSISTK